MCKGSSRLREEGMIIRLYIYKVDVEAAAGEELTDAEEEA